MANLQDFTIYSYGDYSSNNYGAHCLAVKMPQGVFYYSYQTLVAFRSFKSGKLYIRKNSWGTTTGKHLNFINPDKSIRITGEEFVKALKQEGVINNEIEG